MCAGCMAVAMASMMGPAPTVEVPTFIAAPTQVVESEVIVSVPTVAKEEIFITSSSPFDQQAV